MLQPARMNLMSNLLKKLVFSFLSFLVLFSSIAPNFLAAKAAPNPPPPSPVSKANEDKPQAPSEGSWYNQGFGDWFLKVYDDENPSEIFGERYTAAQVQWVIYGIFSYIINIPLGPKGGAIIACVSSAPAANQDLASCLGPALTGLIGDSSIKPDRDTGLLSLVFADRSFSGISYIKHKLNRFDLIPEVQAQTSGFGFDALKPIQDMWIIFRDIAFGLFVITTIVFAFMIMFRVKISPQVVISIQSAIPKIIISLILVTFSYAIAGFLIDFMYVIIGLFSLLLTPLIPNIPVLQSNTYQATDVFNLLTRGQLIGGGGGGIFNLINIYLAPLIILLLVLTVLSGVVAFATGGAGTYVAGFFFILMIIVIIVALWMAIKTVWALFKAFANIILLTIFGPIQLALGPLIPNFGFGQWIRNYLANLSTFVVTGVLWLFAWVFGLLAWQGFFSDAGIVAPAKSSDLWPPLLGSSDFGTALLFAGVSFVFFTLIPKATEIVQGFISGKPFAYGTAIGEAFGPISGPAKFVGGAVGGGVSKYIGTDIEGRLSRLPFLQKGRTQQETGSQQATVRAGEPPTR